MADYNLFGLPPRSETPAQQNKYHQDSKTRKNTRNQIQDFSL
jgi:hypothetical protein